MAKLIAVRLEEEQLQKLKQLEAVSGWNQSVIIRKLIDSAWVTPPAIGTELDLKKGIALVAV